MPAIGAEKEIHQHEWERTWTEQDWRNHVVELQKIDREWQECKAQWRLDKIHHVEFLWQRMNGGMSNDFGVILPRYDENQFKLEKFKYWRDRNMTPLQREESNQRIQEVLKNNRNVLRYIGEVK